MINQAGVATQLREISINGGEFAKIGTEEIGLIMTRDKTEEGKERIPILKELVKRSRNGDTQAMEAIYDYFNRSLYNLVYRYTYNSEIAEDLLQDIFLRVFTKLHTLKKEETFVSWLYRVAINTCFTYLRTRKSHYHRTVSLNDMEERIGEETFESGDKIMKTSLEDAIKNLPARQKTIFLLHDVQGFKHEEIAGMLGCSVGSSKSQLFKARIKIREHLKNKQVY